MIAYYILRSRDVYRVYLIKRAFYKLLLVLVKLKAWINISIGLYCMFYDAFRLIMFEILQPP